MLEEAITAAMRVDVRSIGRAPKLLMASSSNPDPKPLPCIAV